MQEGEMGRQILEKSALMNFDKLGTKSEQIFCHLAPFVKIHSPIVIYE